MCMHVAVAAGTVDVNSADVIAAAAAASDTGTVIRMSCTDVTVKKGLTNLIIFVFADFEIVYSF